jgi:glycosyltransferase involved in cell wall biosynthesis
VSSKQPQRAGDPSPRWSLALIARDEESTLGRVLSDASAFCDQLVVVDTGSTDATADIAKDLGAEVHHFAWIDDFSAARNFAFEQCRGEWIVWLDADDAVPPDAAAGFLGLREHLAGRDDLDGVMVPYRTVFSTEGPEICTFSYDRERVLRRGAGLRWGGVVHEAIAMPWGRFIRWPEAWVEHRPLPEVRANKEGRNLHILEKSLKNGDRTSRTLFYYGNELRAHGRLEEAIEIYREYLAISELEWEKYSALLHLAECAKRLERWPEQLESLFAAVVVDSRRAEAYNRIGVYYYERREWRRAIPFFFAATACERPTDGFVEDQDYSALPWDYLSICYNELDLPEKALEYTFRALLTSTERKRLLENIPFFLQKLTGENK